MTGYRLCAADVIIYCARLSWCWLTGGIWYENDENENTELTMSGKIKLGQEVKDTVTGLRGVAIARTEWLNGCVRWAVQPPVDRDGKNLDAISVDEPQLEVVSEGVRPAMELRAKAAPAAEAGKPGGPYPEPKRAEAPR